MNDLRDYKATVLDALKDLRKKDADHRSDGKSWGWRLKSISRNKIVLRWGYIPDVNISIRLWDDDGDISLSGRMDDRYATDFMNDDDGDLLYVWIGNCHWHDAPSIDKGLRIMIGNIGYITRTRY